MAHNRFYGISKNPVRSQLDDRHLITADIGVFHIYANDDKLILILEFLNKEGQHRYSAREAVIRQEPLSFQSDRGVHEQKVNSTDLENIKKMIEGLESRASEGVVPEKLSAISKTLLEEDVHKGGDYLINPSREEYLTALLKNSVLKDRLTHYIEVASRQAPGRCNVM